MTSPLTSRFALLLSVALVALSVTLAPSAYAEKPTVSGQPKPKAAKPKAAKPKAKAAVPVPAKAAPAGPVRVPRALGPKPEAAPKPAEVPAKDKDGNDIDPLERKNAGKLDGHKWRPHVRG